MIDCNEFLFLRLALIFVCDLTYAIDSGDTTCETDYATNNRICIICRLSILRLLYGERDEGRWGLCSAYS